MKLTKKDKEIIRNTYKKKLREFNLYQAQAVYWKDEVAQHARYRVLCNIGVLNDKSVLDVGCGLGDFSAYLHGRFKNVQYEGFDIVPEMIEGARKKYPHDIFKVAEIENYEGKSFDFIFAAGVFTHKIDKHVQKYFSIIRKMYALAKVGVGFNMLDRKGHIDDELYAAYDPDKVKAFCKGFAEKVEVITDYLPQDFTIYLYRKPEDKLPMFASLFR